MSEEPAVYEARAQHWRERAQLQMLQHHLNRLAATWRCLEPSLPAAREALHRQHQRRLAALGEIPPAQMLLHLPTHGAVLDRIQEGGTALMKDLEELRQRLEALRAEGEDDGHPGPDKPAA